MNNELSTCLIHTGDGQFAKKLSLAPSISETFPIHMTSVFSFDNIADVDAIYENEAQGYIYSRLASPNADAVSEILAAADGGEKALVFSSGMAAITTSILPFVSQGDHIIASHVLYGGVQNFFANELPRFGIEVTFVDLAKDSIDKYVKSNTRLLYTETISNPLMEVPDLGAISQAAHSHNIKVFVDNTFATPVIVKPLSLGADLVLYSATKYLGGHSDIVAGAAVGSTELISKIRNWQILYGGVLSPNDCWLLARSLRTLELRIKKHSENALAVARFLEKLPQVERVFYPGLESSASYENAKKQFENGFFGGMLSIDLKGGENAATALLNALDKITIVPSLAGTATTVSWSAKTSHRFYKREDRLKAGITDGQLRFSIGLESEKDIIAELSAAFNAINRKIYLAGGCFWGVEKYFSIIPGVVRTETGYANGLTEKPTYEDVRYKNSDHAEAVLVEYDPSIIKLSLLLELFYKIIDPTSLNRQGEDVGRQYRTGVYYENDDDKITVEKSLKDLSNCVDGHVVVESGKINNYYTAEEYHQKYLDKNPSGYCHIGSDHFKKLAEFLNSKEDLL